VARALLAEHDEATVVGLLTARAQLTASTRQ
jgi:hypothetical protein